MLIEGECEGMGRSKEKRNSRPFKMAQTFWILDADTFQPVCFTTGPCRVSSTCCPVVCH